MTDQTITIALKVDLPDELSDRCRMYVDLHGVSMLLVAYRLSSASC